MQVDLSNQTALVTGARRGIGQAIADRLAANGAQVAYTDLDGAEAAAAAQGKPGCLGLALDVTSETQIASVVDDLLARWGKIDILVNNAGINTIKNRVTVERVPRAEWDLILNVDLTGPFLVTQRVAARGMIPARRGRIVNIASIAGLVPLRLQAAYDAAKAGLVNLTRCMALELGPHGILVNGIAPGSIVTEGTRQLFYGDGGTLSETAQRMIDHVPLGRPGTVEEIAVAALFLAAPENTYTHGHILTVDGGWTAGYTRDF